MRYIVALLVALVLASIGGQAVFAFGPGTVFGNVATVITFVVIALAVRRIVLKT